VSAVPGSIDVHAHIVPTALLETLRADGGRYGIEVAQQDGRWAALIGGRVQTPPIIPPLLDLPRRLAAMDAAGVDVQLLSSWIDLTAYALDPATGERYARMFNETLAAVVAEHPDRFRGLATVPLQSPEQAAAELRHAVGSLGMVGAEIATTVDGVELDDPGLEPFWAAAEELRCVVVVHPYASLKGRNVKRYALGNLIGNPAESTVSVGHVIFGGVLERHPELRLVFVHGGGFAPYQVGRFVHGHKVRPETRANTVSSAKALLKRFYFDTITHDPQALRYLIELVGAGRIVVGTDSPFDMGDENPRDTLSQLSPEEVATLRRNALRLLEETA
jgi:aminocarboxymuconate-semialdehyde decarboxylase